MKQIHLRVVCITMDQEPIHQKMVKVSDYMISDVPVLFDPPHLLKNTRNSLLKYQIMVS